MDKLIINRLLRGLRSSWLITVVRSAFSLKLFWRQSLLSLMLYAGWVQAMPVEEYRRLETVTVQLRYHHQFQFAGFYAAIAQGYYRDAGLDVKLQEATLTAPSVSAVLSGQAHYGQTQADVLYYRLQGKPLVALAPIFQHSSSALMVLKNSGIRTPHDLQGKRVMFELGDHATNFIAMLNHEGVQLSDLELVPQSYGVDELISGRVDAVGVYVSNRPFLLEQAGIEYHLISPLDYGIDFYGDTLYTSEQEVAEHPERVERFLAATLRGWRYALDHPDEIIDLLIDKYDVKKSREHLRFEAAAIKQLVMPDLIEIGHTNPERWRRMADIFSRQGKSPKHDHLEGFIYQSPKPWYRNYPVEYVYAVLALLLIAIYAVAYFWRLSRHLQEQILAREKAESDNLRLGEILENSLNEIYIMDAETLHFIQVNHGARENTGYSMAELKQLTPLDLKPEYTLEEFKQWTELLKAGLGQVIFETVHKRKDGSLYPVEVNLQMHKVDDKAVFYAVINDISERKAGEQKIKRLTHLYKTLSQINQTIVKTDNETELFESICNIAVDFGHLKLAWIGVTDERDWIVPVAKAGEGQEYIQQLNISVDPDLPEGQGPSGRAFRSGNIVPCNDFGHSRTTQAWQEIGKHYDWQSSCAIPIMRNGTSYAVLNVYTSEPNYFDDEIIQLFDELKNDLSFALKTFDRDQARLKAEEQFNLVANVFQQSLDAIIICDRHNAIISINPAFTRITGYSEAEVIGKNPKLLSSGRHQREFYRDMWQAINLNDYWQGEIWNRRKNGELYPEWLTISAIRNHDGQVTHYIAIFSDISRHKESEARIEHLAHYDPLTDLPNRVLLKAHVAHETASAARYQKSFALLFLDLDLFKNINDSLGHSIGDQLLINVGRRLIEVLRSEDTVARVGGDEFNVLLPGVDYKGAANVAEKIIQAIAEPIEIDHYQLHVTVSIGIALYPDNGEDYETLSKNADTALYQSKHNGRNQFSFFTETMQQAMIRRMEVEHALRLALDKQTLELVYQPQVDTVSGKIIAAEALLRWKHDEWGLVSPSEFIPVAEECGLILPIGHWVLERAVAQAAEWRRAGHPLGVAVNFSMAQFKENTLYQNIQAVLERHQLPPEFLELELTESIVMHNAEDALEIARKLRELGVNLSIDDFGTGYSSLIYLQQFPVNKLKIDQSFVEQMSVNKGSEKIVDTIIGLARSLELGTLAEGVETETQFAMLREKKCQVLQGFLIGKPMTAEAFMALLESDKCFKMER